MKSLHYSWVMVIISVVILATNVLIYYSFGIFLRPVTAEFNWDRGALTAAIAIFMLGAAILAIFSGRLSDKYGPRFLVTFAGICGGIGLLLLSRISSLWQAYLIWGIILSAANGCCGIPVLSTIPRWFAKQGGLAVGLTATGFGLGGMIAPVLTQWLISTSDWRQAYIVLGLLHIIIITPLAQLLKHSPQRVDLKPYGEGNTIEATQSSALVAGGLSLSQAARTGRFWIFSALMFGFMFTIQVVLTQIAAHVADIGISETIAASVVSLIAVTSLIGRNLIGFLCDKMGGRLTLTACMATTMLAAIWLFFSEEAWMFYLFAILFGMSYGGVMPLQTLLARELFGIKFLGILLAVFHLLSVIGGSIGSPFAGYVFDITGGYSLAFLFCIIFSALAVALGLILLRLRAEVGTTANE
jgi:MFS family permease